MARGYIYEITEKKNNLGTITEKDFYDDLQSLSIDYVSDIEEGDQKQIREAIAKEFENHGAKIKKINKSYYSITGLDENFKKSWFKERYENFKALAEKITLEEFALSGHGTVINETKSAIEDSYGDVVYHDSYTEILDDFIRYADEKKTYYLGNIILMH